MLETACALRSGTVGLAIAEVFHLTYREADSMTTPMYRRRFALFTLAVAGLILPSGTPLLAGTLFRDDFNGSISGAWSILRQNSSYYAIRPTDLDLRANSGDLWLGRNNANNLFLIDNPAADDFIATMRLNSFVPTSNTNAPQIDILAYDDDDHHVRCAYGTFGAIGGQRALELAVESGGYSANRLLHDFGGSPFYLRLEKTGNTYTQYHSTDGVTFHQSLGPVAYGDGTPAKLGFVAMSDPYQSSHAYIDYFEVTTNPVPEPSTLVLLIAASGCVAMVGRRWRRHVVGRAADRSR